MKNKKSLLETHPNVAAQWHPTKNNGLTPSDVLPKSHKRAWWLCDKGHEWDAVICNRTKNKKSTGCPYCSGKLPSPDNNLKVKFPDIAKEFHPTKKAKKYGGFVPKDMNGMQLFTVGLVNQKLVVHFVQIRK